VIETFRHRGLRRLFENDDRSGLPADYVGRLRIILSALDAAERAEDLDIHTFRLHPLKGKLQGFWAVTVRANWRVTFRFSGGKALDIDLVDYH
jgi:proteic killer suppression protein